MCMFTVKPGVKYRDVGDVIQKHVQAHGLSVVRSYCGHGIHRSATATVDKTISMTLDN